MAPDELSSQRFETVLARLVALSVRDYYNPYREFEWPSRLPNDEYWMSRNLLSVHGTEFDRHVSDEQRIRLSRWESINFYSLNVHGIRELLLEVIERIHTPGFELPSEFFHHFVGEENEHMWFFAQFCLRYGKKTYPSLSFRKNESFGVDVQHFLVFARILVFEEIVDYFNVRMAADSNLHPTIRKINEIHHQDESRHIAFGREIVRLLHDRISRSPSGDQDGSLEGYLKRYLVSCMQSLYNPQAYRDAGIAEGYELRTQLLRDPVRRAFHDAIAGRTLKFLCDSGIILNTDLPYGD